jgi:hypothetical protein
LSGQDWGFRSSSNDTHGCFACPPDEGSPPCQSLMRPQ